MTSSREPGPLMEEGPSTRPDFRIRWADGRPGMDTGEGRGSGRKAFPFAPSPVCPASVVAGIRVALLRPPSPSPWSLRSSSRKNSCRRLRSLLSWPLSRATGSHFPTRGEDAMASGRPQRTPPPAGNETEAGGTAVSPPSRRLPYIPRSSGWGRWKSRCPLICDLPDRPGPRHAPTCRSPLPW
jgi:hypothetical protein